MPIQLKLIAAAIIIIGSFSTGWAVKGSFVAKEQLAILEAKNELINDFRAIESNISKTVEDKLKNLKANERVINNEILKVIEKPIYSNECLDSRGLQIIERARTGKADSAKPND